MSFLLRSFPIVTRYFIDPVCVDAISFQGSGTEKMINFIYLGYQLDSHVMLFIFIYRETL